MPTVEQSVAQLQQTNAELVVASNELTSEVTSKLSTINSTVSAKMGEVDSTLNNTITTLNDWRSNVFQSDDAKRQIQLGSKTGLDLVHLDSNTFYPVIFKGSPTHINEYEISRWYEEKKGDSLGSAGLFLKFSYVGDLWGGNPNSLYIHRNEQTYILSAGALGYVNYYHACVFLRGGYFYNIFSNNPSQDLTLYEVKTKYYESPNPDHDSWIGPVSLGDIETSLGVLTVGPIFNAPHNKDISQLGGGQ